ncbi:hypothetical protein [Winogradskyella pulchriflava]|uniref:Uncharacterized protein n=1 Tax=Winogradskyella pulchriflava TaxID=1110688 RepID=A0ABV6Q8M1_9FLAO
MLHKVLKIVAALISLLGIVSLVRIISKGDDAIDAAAQAGDTAIVEPMAWAAYIMLGLVLVFVIVFVLKNLFTNSAGLKNTLIGVGAFVAVLVIAYVLSDNENPIMNDGKYLFKYGDKAATSNEIQMSGAGLVAFYILLALAAITMVFSGVKKIISK